MRGNFSNDLEKPIFQGDIYTKGNKTKLRTIVYLVGTSGIIKGGDWYTDAAKSLGVKKVIARVFTPIRLFMMD